MSELTKILEGDTDGMATYEYIVNNIDTCSEDMTAIVDNLKRVDVSGQFLASTARFLMAVDPERFSIWLTPLVDAAIQKDREHKYILSLLEAIWGKDYADRADELRESDDNFRRIYKRVFPQSPI
ncbi:MAG: hypothetical protein HDS67_00775 [Bacteroidales bacterium]|nr:hypothetical protein [Bacteroidales bacterium]MBD5283989.1 hypothetical protein [Bacteroides sp.]